MTALAGTGQLLRLALRRDRIILPLWVVLLALFPASVAGSFKALYPDPVELAKFAKSMIASPSITGFYGPIFAPNLGQLSAWRSGILVIIAALAVGLTVIRHTRNEEEQGRRELLGATVVGRPAQLVAALLLAFGASAVIGVLAALGLASAAPGAGAWAFGLEYAVLCAFFGAVAGLAAQLTQSARTARWIFGAVLGGSFLLRAAGDANGDENSVLSWLSPIGFAQRIRPYAGERWWIGGVLLLIAVALGLWAYQLAGSRDIDAGLVAPRPGPPRAGRSLSSPLGLAWRLQRGGLIGWLIGFAVISGVLGSAATTASDALKDSPELAEMFQRLGGATALGDLFMVTLISITAIAAAGQGIQAAVRARSEETTGRLEPILATAVGRPRWNAGYVLFALGGPVLSMLVVGVVGGLAYGGSSGDVAGQLPRIIGAALVSLPAIWLTVSIVLALFGLLPRLVAAGWVLLAAFLLLGQLGAVLRLSQWALDLSPFTHTPHLPGGDLTWPPLIWLSVLSVVLTALGFAGFRRRDIG
ncbi:MAG: ABC transporter permease [Hamadaea sp.]|nr:ABC transporter permease [Hamadaea sp.]NUR50931.1 ABC transporter permease [Hamadaea sp.]